MSEHANQPLPTEVPLAPVVVLGGVLTMKQLLPVYRGILDGGQPSPVTAAERFFPIPHRHLAQPAEMYDRYEERLERVYDKLGGERMVVVGHSLGGLLASVAGLRRPDIVSSVVCLAGAQEGVRHNTPTMRALKRSIGRPDIVKHVDHDSDFMQGHRQQVETEWPEDVSLHLVAATADDLFLLPQGLKLKLPDNRQPERRVVAPYFPGISQVLRRIPGMPQDVKHLPSRRPTGHCDLPLSGAVKGYVLGVRQGATEAATDNQIAEVAQLPSASQHSKITSMHGTAAA